MDRNQGDGFYPENHRENPRDQLEASMQTQTISMRQLERLVRKASTKSHQIIQEPPVVHHRLIVNSRELFAISDGRKAVVTYPQPN